MRTIKEVERQEKIFRLRSKCFKWIRKHINYRFGDFLISKSYDAWSDYLDWR